jgi:hypothetical protein
MSATIQPETTNRRTVIDSHRGEIDVLCHPRRRQVIRILGDRPEATGFAELVDWVTEAEYDAPLDALSEEEHREVAVSLHHLHLPWLEAAGLVEYDLVRGLVIPTEELVTIRTEV